MNEYPEDCTVVDNPSLPLAGSVGLNCARPATGGRTGDVAPPRGERGFELLVPVAVSVLVVVAPPRGERGFE